MRKVVIVGASGYTGHELIKILSRHSNVKISSVISNTNVGRFVFELYPDLKGICDNLVFEKYNKDNLFSQGDIFFYALPHGISMEYIDDDFVREKIIIDLSADFRIKEKSIYEAWYKKTHIQSDFLKKAVFGQCEINRELIKDSKFIANPGCYATSMIVPLYPLINENLLDLDYEVIIDSKSGVSGAGKKLDNMYLFNEQNENFLPYNPLRHRHVPEVVEFLKEKTEKEISLIFVPHLLPVTRGILSSIYIKLKETISLRNVKEIYKKYYGNEFFIRILDSLPTIRAVANTNFCDIGFALDEDRKRLIVFCAIDNLLKGASGQAVQNMNIILGIDEKEGLI